MSDKSKQPSDSGSVASHCSDSFAQSLERLEPLIASLANQYKSRFVQFDDLRQEIRVQAWKRWQKFDPARCESPAKWIEMTMRKSAIDAVRAWTGRNGEQVRMCGDLVETERELDVAVVEPNRECEWDDFVEAASTNRETQCVALFASGMLMREIADHVGISEARVSQIIKRLSDEGRARLLELVAV